LWAQIYIIYLI